MKYENSPHLEIPMDNFPTRTGDLLKINLPKALEDLRINSRIIFNLGPKKEEKTDQESIAAMEIQTVNSREEIEKLFLSERMKEYNHDDMRAISHSLWASDELRRALSVGLNGGQKINLGLAVEYLLGWIDIKPSSTHGLYYDSAMPDVDVDLSDEKRDLVFDYLEEKYGKDRVARLATVTLFQSKSCLNAAGAALGVPSWMIDNASNEIITRSKGDSRADYKVQDSFDITDAGKKLIKEYPKMAIAGKIEAHPNVRSQHAAGVVMTDEPVREFVAVDASNSTAMCDKEDAKDLDLLKVDVLGLTQLSIFEQTLRLVGKKDTSGFLETLPLDDAKTFEVLNKRHLAGIFQFQGGTTKQVVHQLNKVTEFEDIVSITALCRPGPLGSGGTQSWIDRKNGIEPVTYIHPIFQPYLEKTLGVTIYQEQIMQICREIGGMNWTDITALRKAMGKSLGVEYFDKYRDEFLPQAIEKGVPQDIALKMWLDMCRFGTYGFNRSHAVAYGLVTYYSCYLKAHYPVEFAAATLDAETEPAKHVAVLRELKEEGVDYVPVDPETSGQRWAVRERDGKKILVGPLTMIHGVGPVAVRMIMKSREEGTPLTQTMLNKLTTAKTSIDSLFPVQDAINRLWPDLRSANIVTKPTLVKDVFEYHKGRDVVVIGMLVKNHPLNENEPGRIARRGYAIPEGQPVNALNFHLQDDTDDIFCKVSRWKFPEIGHILTSGRPGKSLFAIKGTVPISFRMVWVERVKYLGEITDEGRQLDLLEPRPSPGDRPAGTPEEAVAAE